MKNQSSQFSKIKQDPFPAGFLELRKGEVRAWVKQGFSFLFDEYGKLKREDSFSAQTQGSPYSGRGEMTRIPLGIREQRTHEKGVDDQGAHNGSCALIRHYRRGGLFQYLSHDLFFGKKRFFEEVWVSEWARTQNVASTEVLAIRSEKKRFCHCYRGDLVTREIEAAEDLDRYLRSLLHTGPPARSGPGKAVIFEVARLLRKMHGVGLYHADLNLKNILLQFNADGVKSYIIDLDRARVFPDLPPRYRRRNLERLYRSLEKQGHIGSVLTKRDLLMFLKVYCGTDKALEKRCKALMRRAPLTLWYHRILWRIFRRRRKPSVNPHG